MRDEIIGDTVGHLVSSLTACNKLLLAVAFSFAFIALLLAGICGYLAGRHQAKKQEQVHHALPSQANTALVAGDARQGLGSSVRRDGSSLAGTNMSLQQGVERVPSFAPAVTSRAHTRLPSFAQTVPPIGVPVTDDLVAALVKRDSETWKMQYVPEDLKPAYAQYVSQWVNTDTPWEDPLSVRASRLGSRLQSMASGLSTAMTATTEFDDDWKLPMNPKKGIGAQLLMTDWNIQPNQLQFCYNPNGELIKLSCVSGPRPEWQNKPAENFKAVLDGKIDVAVKVIKAAKGSYPEASLVQLALYLLSLNSCQHIVHFWGICQTDENVMIVSEYIQGGCMREAIKRDREGMQWYKSGKVIARSVAQALIAIHSNNMGHRTLKTKKVLVGEKNNSAKLCGVLTETMLRCTKKAQDTRLASAFEWTPPEVLLGKRYGPPADMFAFGVILWELVTQELPIRGALREVRVPGECPLAIQKLMKDCMSKEPEDRPTAKQAVDRIQKVWNLKADGTLAEQRGSGFQQNAAERAFSSSGSSPERSVPGLDKKPQGQRGKLRRSFDNARQKQEKGAAIVSIQSSPVSYLPQSEGNRRRIEESLRSGMEMVYAYNRERNAKTSRNSRSSGLVSYMSRPASPEPESQKLSSAPDLREQLEPQRPTSATSAPGGLIGPEGENARLSFEVMLPSRTSDSGPDTPSMDTAAVPVRQLVERAHSSPTTVENLQGFPFTSNSTQTQKPKVPVQQRKAIPSETSSDGLDSSDGTNILREFIKPPTDSPRKPTCA